MRSMTLVQHSNFDEEFVKATDFEMKDFFRRQYALIIVVIIAWQLVGSGATNAQESVGSQTAVEKIAFGSCASQLKPCPIWGTIADFQPELLLLLGDNIYADVVESRLVPATPDRIAESYEQLAALPDFDKLRRQTKILATWDDHDYGNNDAGVEWEHKDAAAKLFHDFFGTPQNSPLRQQKGIYSSKIFGPAGKRVQVILLDTRYFRSELDTAEQPMPGFRARPYIKRTGPDATLLGETQWAWLEQQLLQPAEVRLICSSIQVVSDQHPFEKWDNFPLERERLYKLIQKCEASGVIILSGDRHHGEISVNPFAVGYPLYDVTASGLNQATDTWKQLEENRYRVAGLGFGDHFGCIEIDWQPSDPLISMQLRWEDGQVAVQARVPLSVLTAPPRPLPLAAGVISAAEALTKNEGDQVEVQFAVQGGRMIGDGSRALLNSLADYRDERNFTIVINNPGDSLTDISALLGKTIRAKGVISVYRGAKQLVIDSPTAWQTVEIPTANKIPSAR